MKEFRNNVELKGKGCQNLYIAPLLFRTSISFSLLITYKVQVRNSNIPKPVFYKKTYLQEKLKSRKMCYFARFYCSHCGEFKRRELVTCPKPYMDGHRHLATRQFYEPGPCNNPDGCARGQYWDY